MGETSTALGWSDLSSIVTAVTSQFSVATVTAVIVGLIGATIAFNFLWWGARKATAAVKGAAQGSNTNGLAGKKRRR